MSELDTNTTPISQKPATGPITFDLVKEAFEAGHTNAQKIRDHLGRGSMATIQKHLQTLRSEVTTRAAEQVALDSEVPPPAGGVVNELWAAAWRAAHGTVHSLINRLTAERDLAVERVAVAEEDAELMRSEVERTEAEIDTLKAEHASMKDERDQSKHLAEKIAQEKAILVVTHEQAISQMTSENNLALKDAHTRVEVLSSTLDRQGEREGHLRAELQEAQRRNDELVQRLALLAGSH